MSTLTSVPILGIQKMNAIVVVDALYGTPVCAPPQYVCVVHNIEAVHQRSEQSAVELSLNQKGFCQLFPEIQKCFLKEKNWHRLEAKECLNETHITCCVI